MKVARGWSPALAAALLLGCAAGPEPLPLRPVQDLGPDFRWRQRLHFRAGPTEGVLDAVLRKQGNELLVLLLDPLGVPLATLRQRGRRVYAERTQKGFELPPRRVLADIHRASFWPTQPPAGGEGETRREHGDWAVVERWERGRLLERCFTAQGAEKPQVVVQFEPREGRGGLPPTFYLINHRFGYEIEVRSLAHTVRSPDAEAPRP